MIMTPPLLELGVIYTGVAVTRTVTLSNLTDLGCHFKFVQPERSNSNCRVKFEPSSGALGPKDSCVIHIETRSKVVAVIDVLLACIIHGVKKPLPLAVRAISKGVQVDLRALHPEEPVPTPLDEPTAPQFDGAKELLAVSMTAPLDFGELRLYARKTLRLAVRNLSAIPTTIAVAVRNFPANTRQAQGNGRKTTNLAGRTYQSSQGKEYIRSKVQKLEDIAVLSTESGVAFELSQTSTQLPAWGVIIIAITAYNKMPGRYELFLLLGSCKPNQDSLQ